MKLKIKKLHPLAQMPTYATDGSGCFDIKAIVEGPPVNVYYDVPVVFRTGLAFEVPEGWVLALFSRSGHGFKNDTRLSNCVGILDSDYRGECMVKLQRDTTTGQGMTVAHGDRIVQGLLIKAEQVDFVLVDELSSTERGAGGFGSSGR